MDEFRSITIWLLLSLFSLANSLSFEEHEAIFYENDCKVGRCEVIEVELSGRQKRSVDSRISFPLKAFGRERTLNLRQSSGVLISPNTPIYFARSSTKIEATSYQMVSSLARSQFYEDEANLAAFTLDIDSDRLKIKYGVVRSENLTIIPLNPFQKSSDSSQRQYYLAKYTWDDAWNSFTNMLGMNSIGYFPRKSPVPAQVYPEILLIVDHALLEIHGNSIFQHTIELWNQIDALYRPLQNPKYKLSIAGFVIPENRRVFNSLQLHGSIDYGNVLTDITAWLHSAQNSIPFNSYDVHMVMTAHEHYDGVTLGLTSVGSACSAVQSHYPHGGVFLDSLTDHKTMTTGAHELAHALGLHHDDNSFLGIFSYSSGTLMGSSRGNNKWSQQSRKELQEVMESTDFSCLDNYPLTGFIPTSNSKPYHINNYLNRYQPNDIKPPMTKKPRWSFSDDTSGFDNKPPTNIDSGSSFGSIDIDSLQPPVINPPATWNSRWSPDDNTNNFNDWLPKSPYPGFANDDDNDYNNNNNDFWDYTTINQYTPDIGDYSYGF